MSLLNKIKEKMKNIEEIAGYLHYIFDREKWESRLYPLPLIKPSIELREFSETYALDKVAYYLDGKPVFLVIRGIPYSMEIEQTEKNLTLKGYTASEIQAKLNSVYVNNVFRKGTLQFKDYLVLILSNVITGLSIYIITTMFKGVET